MECLLSTVSPSSTGVLSVYSLALLYYYCRGSHEHGGGKSREIERPVCVGVGVGFSHSASTRCFRLRHIINAHDVESLSLPVSVVVAIAVVVVVTSFLPSPKSMRPVKPRKWTCEHIQSRLPSFVSFTGGD